jgi:hypothetical protein
MSAVSVHVGVCYSCFLLQCCMTCHRLFYMHGAFKRPTKKTSGSIQGTLMVQGSPTERSTPPRRSCMRT